MLAQDQMRHGAQTMAAIFGGPGVFYAVESFQHAEFALTGLFYLTAATVLLLLSDGKTSDTLVRCKARIFPRKRR